MLGVFFLDKFQLFSWPNLTEFFLSFKKYRCLELKFEKLFHHFGKVMEV